MKTVLNKQKKNKKREKKTAPSRLKFETCCAQVVVAPLGGKSQHAQLALDCQRTFQLVKSADVQDGRMMQHRVGFGAAVLLQHHHRVLHSAHIQQTNGDIVHQLEKKTNQTKEMAICRTVTPIINS